MRRVRLRRAASPVGKARDQIDEMVTRFHAAQRQLHIKTRTSGRARFAVSADGIRRTWPQVGTRPWSPLSWSGHRPNPSLIHRFCSGIIEIAHEWPGPRLRPDRLEINKFREYLGMTEPRLLQKPVQ
jgi:hypothetical protein